MDKDILPNFEQIEFKDVKVRISIMLDGDILNYFKTEADRLHVKYQTLINQKLREVMNQPNTEARIDSLEDSMREVMLQLKKRA